MPRYRKRPVVIDAFQMTKAARADPNTWPEWLHDAWLKKAGKPGSMWPRYYPNSDGNDRLMVGTLEGALVVSFNDFIIRGVEGELYPCKPNIFAASYEEEAA